MTISIARQDFMVCPDHGRQEIDLRNAVGLCAGVRPCCDFYESVWTYRVTLPNERNFLHSVESRLRRIWERIKMLFSRGGYRVNIQKGTSYIDATSLDKMQKSIRLHGGRITGVGKKILKKPVRKNFLFSSSHLRAFLDRDWDVEYNTQYIYDKIQNMKRSIYALLRMSWVLDEMDVEARDELRKLVESHTLEDRPKEASEETRDEDFYFDSTELVVNAYVDGYLERLDCFTGRERELLRFYCELTALESQLNLEPGIQRREAHRREVLHKVYRRFLDEYYQGVRK